MKELLSGQTSGIILSAGNSARMGTHKALLKFDSERTFIQKITETYLLAGIEHVIVVVNTELLKLISQSDLAISQKVHFVVNEKPELGRFYSLQTGVKHLESGNSCFFQNIDNPFITIEILNELLIHKHEAEVVLPAFQAKTGHPVLLSPSSIHQIYTAIDYELRIDLFLKQFTQRRIETSDQRILININSPDDYQNAGFIV